MSQWNKIFGSSDRQAYNDVFLHTARDSPKTLDEGQQAYKVISRDRYGAPHETASTGARPALQPTFMAGPAVHDIAKAMKRLDEVRGFWVEMPLRWGMQEKASVLSQ
jgi:phospholipase D1/2